MQVVTKRALLFALKLAVLGLVLAYAERQVQIDDELVARVPSEIPAASGGTLRVAAGQRFAITPITLTRGSGDSPGSTEPRYEARAPDGSRVVIETSEIDGPQPRFERRPGLRTVFRNLDLARLAWAFAMFGPAIFLMAVRWRTLLVASGISVPFSTIVRLHYMAFFLNSFMPGGAGGDIVKAVYVTRHSEQKAEAATMVLIDRVVGVIGLLLMAGVVVLFEYEKMSGIALQIGAIALVLALGTVLFFSSPFRRLIRYDWLLTRLPKSEVLRRVDGALYGMKDKKGALAATLGLTIGLQFLEVVGVFFAGGALGMEKATFAHYLVFVPIGYLFNAIPLSFGGIGIMEGAYLKLFHDAGVATAAQGFMLGVLARLIVVGWSLPGAVSALFPPARERSTSNT
jgi:uncharacterized protein (TIRG00374 family)